MYGRRLPAEHCCVLTVARKPREQQYTSTTLTPATTPLNNWVTCTCMLKTGWSVKTQSLNTFSKPEALNESEQQIILQVIKRAEMLEQNEQERVGKLVERLENMKRNAMGNGTNQCILCGDHFGMLSSSHLLCQDCKKLVCQKCGVDTLGSQKEPTWLCKICAETREMWKKSGAWFFKGLPKYILPEKKAHEHSKYSMRYAENKRGMPKQFSGWTRGSSGGSGGKGSSELEEESSSDDELKRSRLARAKKVEEGHQPQDGNPAYNASPCSSVSEQVEKGTNRSNSSNRMDTMSTNDSMYMETESYSESERSVTSNGRARQSDESRTEGPRTGVSRTSLTRRRPIIRRPTRNKPCDN